MTCHFAVSVDANGQSVEPGWTTASLRSHWEKRSDRDSPEYQNSSHVWPLLWPHGSVATYISVFNLFSEAEPFAGVLNFWFSWNPRFFVGGDSWGRNLRPKAESGGGFLADRGTVFFNFFGEEEPFAAVLIAHRGDCWGQKGQKLRRKAESGGEASPLPTSCRVSWGVL